MLLEIWTYITLVLSMGMCGVVVYFLYGYKHSKLRK